MSEDKLPSVSDPRQVEERSRKAKRTRKQEIEDLKAVLALPEGRRFVWRLLERVYQASFNPNNSVMSFNEGERNSALKLWNDVIEADPSVIPKLMTET